VLIYRQDLELRTKTSQQADKVLDAAAHLFGNQRFHEVRMDDVAAEAEVGKGTLYRYFSDKEDLFLALLDRASRQLLARLEKEKTFGGTARVRLQRFVKALIQFFDERPHFFDLIQRGEVMRESNHDFPWQKARDEVFQVFTDLFKEGTAKGDLQIPDPHLATCLILGGLRTVIRFGAQPRHPDLVKNIVDSFLDGADRRGKSCQLDSEAAPFAGATSEP
jgi:AcrR family transcriptional regulator